IKHARVLDPRARNSAFCAPRNSANGPHDANTLFGCASPLKADRHLKSAGSKFSALIAARRWRPGSVLHSLPIQFLDAALPFTIRQTVIKPEQAACLAAWKCLKQDRIHQCSSVEALQPGGSSQIPYDLPDQFGPAG